MSKSMAEAGTAATEPKAFESRPIEAAVIEARAIEIRRLQALRALKIVDTKAEPEFDAVCALAQAMFNVPTVLISLVEEDRQWFKARCGFDPEGTTRDVSFCALAILADEVLSVEDASRDPRFATNPLVTGAPGIRFYAGAPLILRPGVRVGTICVIDLVPRRLDEADRQKLESFASIVVALLRLHEANGRLREEIEERALREEIVARQARELGRREAALRKSNDLLLLAEEMAGAGHWRLELPGRRREWSPTAYRIMGLDPSGPPPPFDDDSNGYDRRDRERVRDIIDAAVARRKPFSFEARVVQPGGSIRDVAVRGRCEDSTGTGASEEGVAADHAGREVRALFGIIVDITERKRTEERLRSRDRELTAVLDNMPARIGYVDKDLRIRLVNKAYSDWFAKPPYAIVGSHVRDVVGEQTYAQNRAHMEAALSGEKQRFERTGSNGDGTRHDVLASYVPDIRDGQTIGFFVLVMDITNQKIAEAQLQASGQLYRTLADSLPQMIWIVRDGDRVATYVNQRFEAFYGPLGMTREDRIARNHPDDLEKMEMGWAAAQRGGRMFEVEGRLQRRDGAFRWHKIVATPVSRDGIVAEWLCTALDIDDIVAARQTLLETTHLLTLSQEAAGAGVFDVNLLTEEVTLSRESAAMHGFGATSGTMVPMAAWIARIHPADAPRSRLLMETACAERGTYSCEFRVPLEAGGLRWIQGIGRAHYDLAGRAVRMIGLHFDVTDRKTSEAELIAASAAAESARREAEHASAAKSEFLASMSHEIRTPLNSIIGYTELLLDDGSHAPGDRRKMELIQESGSALLTVVNDILDFSKIEAGQIELDPVAFPLRNLFDNVLAMVSGFADKADLRIEREIEAGLPSHVLGDANRLRQILLNLLNNAIKFTPAGVVTLRVALEGPVDHLCRIRVTVTDTGIGISKVRSERLFQRFSQIDGSVARRFGGTGLGLAISKSLVNLMGGDIGVDSIEGSGSSFWFRLAMPVCATQGPASPATVAERTPKTVKPARILLVEDVVVNQDLARLILEAQGHRVSVASDGFEAVAMVSSQDFDLVLMDIQMPGMDGVTATQAIRALDHACRTVPIVAMTANVLPQQVAAFKSAGMNDHVGKPIRREALYATIARWTDRPQASRDTTPVLDRAVMDELRNTIGEAFFKTLVGKFAIELTARFASIPPDIVREQLAGDAHAMISASGSLGFSALSKCCRRAEMICKEGGAMPAAIALLQDAARRALEEIRSWPAA